MSPATDPGLLRRLRNWEDRGSWGEFYGLYFKYIYGFARRSGLGHADAEEVTQDVFKCAAEAIHDFESDPERGKFRGWLMNIARWRVSDKFRARRPDEAFRAEPAVGESGGAPREILDQLADGHDAGSAWEDEWRRLVFEAALRRLSRRVPAKQFQVFELYVRQHWPALRVARELGLTLATVYLIRHRLARLLKAEIESLRKVLD